MRNICKYIGILLIAVSCIQREDSPVFEDGMVEVQILAPQLYGHVPNGSRTKADDENQVGDIKDRLNDDHIVNLPDGTTLWLTYEHLHPTLGHTAPNLKAYVVKSSSGGYQALYACQHSEEDGKLVVNTADISSTATPLYLKNDSTYRFRMISPAMPIDKETLSMTVDNGDSFCSSDQRYLQTSPQDIKIVSTASGVNYLSLQPMIQQTARLRFHLIKGDNVSALDVMGDGVEISGIQNPYSHNKEGDIYQWSSMNPADTLVMRKGDKRAWINLPGNRFVKDADGNLSGDICILPTDARSNTVTILLNIAVNGVPTQYITSLNGMVFEHAKSYNMGLTVALRQNVVVVNWQNVSWTEDI